MIDNNNILATRAQKNAAIPNKEDSASGKNYLLFKVVNKTFAIEESWIKEIFKVSYYTEIPGTPNFITGVVNIRGEIYSAINLISFLYSRELGLSELKKLIILTGEKNEFGITSDEVMGFSHIKDIDISPIPSSFNDVCKEFILGINESGILILNGKSLTESKKLIIDII